MPVIHVPASTGTDGAAAAATTAVDARMINEKDGDVEKNHHNSQRHRLEACACGSLS